MSEYGNLHVHSLYQSEKCRKRAKSTLNVSVCYVAQATPSRAVWCELFEKHKIQTLASRGRSYPRPVWQLAPSSDSQRWNKEILLQIVNSCTKSC